MSRMRPEYLDPDFTDRLTAAGVLLRQEPDEEEDEEEDEDDGEENDDDGGKDDDGYSEALASRIQPQRHRHSTEVTPN
jgi:hypothetical protein